MCALFVEEGQAAVTEVVLSAASVRRVRAGGRPVAEELATVVAAQLPALILNACQPPRAKPGRKPGRRSRSRAEIEAGIRKAKEARARRQASEQAWLEQQHSGLTAES
jgi:hypothetical protein